MTAAITAALVVSACGPTGHDHPKALAGWPASLDAFTITWSADPGVDLTKGPAVVARAYTESYQLVSLTGDESYLYSGFAGAVDRSLSGGDDQHLWPDTKSSAKTPWVGTEHDTILSITQSGKEVTVIGCMYTYAAGMQDATDHDRRYISQDGGKHGADDAGIAPMRIILTPPADPQNPPLPTQSGPARTPATDVFSGYRVIANLGGYFVPGASPAQWPEQRATLGVCVSKAPDPVERRRFLTSDFHGQTDFPVATPFPGWPAVAPATTSR